MKYTLYPPGARKRSKYWTFRASVAGHQVEASCRTTDEVAARKFADHFVANLRAAHDHLFPRPRLLGAFEEWLLANLYWDNGVRWTDGAPLPFYKAVHGYRSAQVDYLARKRTVLEHRVVFLLVHKWLPDSIDHKDRVRSHNHPSNLEASTPYRQAQNRGHGQRSRSVSQLIHRVRRQSRRGKVGGNESLLY